MDTFLWIFLAGGLGELKEAQAAEEEREGWTGRPGDAVCGQVECPEGASLEEGAASADCALTSASAPSILRRGPAL
jgi:hypothetical protein